MKAVIQRVSEARVVIAGETVGEIGPGCLVLLGVATDDTPQDVDWLAQKLVGLRIFEDAAGKMNHSLLDGGGQVLIVSQFTLYGDVRKGRRPSFTEAAAPAVAEGLYEKFIAAVRAQGLVVATGRFGAMMDVSSVNNGPVTLIADTKSIH